MCFSATVSFGASAVLGGLGIASIRKAKSPPLKALALTPLIFAYQQFVEGWLWLSLQDAQSSLSLQSIPILTKTFLVFAWIIWPFFIPYFTYRLEKNPARKTILKFIFYLGIVVSSIMIYILSIAEIRPSIHEHHIFYERLTAIPGILSLSVFYVFALLAPFFLSTTKNIKYLGIINLISFIIARWLFATHFISVWCFFAAISSTYIFILVKQLVPFYENTESNETAMFLQET